MQPELIAIATKCCCQQIAIGNEIASRKDTSLRAEGGGEGEREVHGLPPLAGCSPAVGSQKRRVESRKFAQANKA